MEIHFASIKFADGRNGYAEITIQTGHRLSERSNRQKNKTGRVNDMLF